MKMPCYFSTFALFAIALVRETSANVIGLDVGSDSMKIAIVQPGTPLGMYHVYFYFKYRSILHFSLIGPLE
jgi:hypothetical protein